MKDSDCSELAVLRGKLDVVNQQILELLNERARLVLDVQQVKRRNDINMFCPGRENQMLDDLVACNKGPFSDAVVRQIFKEIFRASLESMQAAGIESLTVSRSGKPGDVVINVRGHEIGRAPVVIAGPCAIESEQQAMEVARHLVGAGVFFMRGGAFKPRTSPYSFQGLGQGALEILDAVRRETGVVTVTEVTDTRSVDAVAAAVDILQVGSRNMANYELLRAVGATGKPVLLKRGFAATLDEFLLAAEYVAREGNEQIILCERGIRTFARETRYTLDISAVPILRQSCRLPVLVDVSHASGRRDLVVPLAKAAMAAGASGVMVEVHPAPAMALSDSAQQLDFDEFDVLLRELGMAGPDVRAAATGDNH